MVSDSLRERSKARRREAILRAAYTLFAEHGFDATTIAQIAAAADVSPRTVTLYFPSKLDLALSRFHAFADRLGAALREREEDWTTLDALEHWLRGEIAHRSELDGLAERMLATNPQLRAVAGARLTDVVQDAVRMLAKEQGGAPGDFGPRIAAAAAAAVIGEAVHRPEAADIDTAMAFLRAGVATLPSAADHRS
ncbi:TetR family transcriptional regulator [Streptomyces sp. NPDC005571]|uniref:TetR/AcrR family transcriptional regulator n=1 Tax=Streptomyces sp. NPDC005571 TaxID=3156888 RepID=UPI0033BEA7B5